MRRNVIGLLVSAVLIVALTVPAAAGGMKPFVARTEQVLAIPSDPPTEGRLKEMVDAYAVKDNLTALLFFTRDQEEQNNVGGNCTAVAYEALFLYSDKPADWFMTRTITTANGDEIYQELSGIAYPEKPAAQNFSISVFLEIMRILKPMSRIIRVVSRLEA